MTTSIQREKIQLQWHKVHRDCDGGTNIATAFKDDDEPLLLFIRRCVDMLRPEWREEVVKSYDGRQEVVNEGWNFRKVVGDNGAKYLEFWWPCHISVSHDCSGQICSDEIFVTMGANGLVVFMREYRYDV